MKKIRADILLIEKGLVESREKAKRLILAGKVLAGKQPVNKPGKEYDINTEFKIIEKNRFVSRGGNKLEFFLQETNIDINNKICFDIGCSTGGFTDCLIQRGAKKVYAVDVGKGILDWKLRNDRRVIVKEGVNARYLNNNIIEELCDIGVMDVSFISVEKIIPNLYNYLKPNGFLIVLIKPQFEAGKKFIEKGGVVKDINIHRFVISKIKKFCTEQKFEVLNILPSKVKGAKKGNQEYFMLLKKNES